jgi:hypothetical protein
MVYGIRLLQVSQTILEMYINLYNNPLEIVMQIGKNIYAYMFRRRPTGTQFLCGKELLCPENVFYKTYSLSAGTEKRNRKLVS